MFCLHPLRVFARVVVATLILAAIGSTISAAESTGRHSPAGRKHVPEVAAVVTAYYHNSHADVIVSRLLQSMTLDWKGEHLPLKLVSLYVDQPQISAVGLEIAKENHIPIYKTVTGALTRGGSSLAVDGVLLIGEHGSYPLSKTGQVMFPKRRLFSEILEVFDHSGRIVPVYTDKHLSDNWEDAKWLYDSAHRRDIPLMAGSSLPVTWRYPPIDVRRGARIAEIAVTTFGGLEAYGFHGLEIIQCLAERRAGGETGVRSVQTLTGDQIWDGARHGLFNVSLLETALSRRRHHLPGPAKGNGRELHLEGDLVNPVVVLVDYRDGLRATMLYADNLREWTAAWREAETNKVESTLFWTQEARPFMHFAYLVKGIEQMIVTGKPAWPVERTLYTTGILNAFFRSKQAGGQAIETSWLDIHYHCDHDWQQPPPPPTGRPIPGQ
jgi:hypothetical protein